MPKNRKTRKQKVSSDQKRKVVQPATVHEKSSPTSTHSYTFSPTTISRPVATGIDIASYHYLGKDLRKTFILTLSIIVMELVLSFFMR